MMKPADKKNQLKDSETIWECCNYKMKLAKTNASNGKNSRSIHIGWYCSYCGKIIPRIKEGEIPPPSNDFTNSYETKKRRANKHARNCSAKKRAYTKIQIDAVATRMLLDKIERDNK